MACYSKVGYWNHRYQHSQKPFEWYQTHETLKHLLNPATLACPPTTDENYSPELMAMQQKSPNYEMFHKESCRVLILGCGNSSLGEDLVRDGWKGRIVQVDFSPVVVDQMKKKYTKKFYETFQRSTPMEFVCADFCENSLPFEKESFDLIICKGTFDAILTSVGSLVNARRMIQESLRLLQRGGVFFLVTYGNPDSRVVFLECQDNELETYWQGVSVHTIPSKIRSKKDYVYVCRKRLKGLNSRKTVNDGHLAALASSEKLMISNKTHF